MENRGRRAGLIVFLIALSLGAALFSYEPLWNSISSFRPWTLGLDLAGGSVLTYEIDLKDVAAADRDSVVQGLRDVIEKRVNLFGVSEPRVYTASVGDTRRLVVELAGIRDVGTAIKEIGATPFLEFREVREETSSGTSTVVFEPTALTGRYVIGAQVSRDPTSRLPEIDFSLNDEGAKLFEEITGKNVGKPICLFVDGAPIVPDNINDSCPRVQGAIAGGKARITGQFTLERAKTLTERFNAGALPAPITLVHQETVSPELGKDSLEKAVAAGALGTLAVIIFMLIYYRGFGSFAAAALLMYVALTLGVFKLIPITLSLSGIAGFILSIGMAVDANILVFERTKEELKKGLARSVALEEGFRRAWTSIRDSNISTMLTAAVLYYFTTSFVRGFALTLFIGVVMSMFSAITVTRTLLRVFMAREQTAGKK